MSYESWPAPNEHYRSEPDVSLPFLQEYAQRAIAQDPSACTFAEMLKGKLAPHDVKVLPWVGDTPGEIGAHAIWEAVEEGRIRHYEGVIEPAGEAFHVILATDVKRRAKLLSSLPLLDVQFTITRIRSRLKQETTPERSIKRKGRGAGERGKPRVAPVAYSAEETVQWLKGYDAGYSLLQRKLAGTYVPPLKVPKKAPTRITEVVVLCRQEWFKRSRKVLSQ